MLKVFYVGVNGLTADAVLHTLSDYRLERLKKTARSEAKAQSLAAELLLIHAVRTVYPEAELPLKITVGEFGKPELRGIELEFSLSHSADMVLCAISSKCVGADIQLRAVYNAALAERFFTKQEAAAIAQAADKDRMFTQTWAVKESYLKLHPTGPKHDYNYHTEAMDRAMEGGIDDVGLGVLFGLELYRYEFAGLLMHAEHLEAVHGVGPHTISMPRVKHADDIDPNAFDNSISDEIFAKLCALIRIAVPYTGMIISTRESQDVREKLLRLGISQVSGASRTSVGGYCEEERPHDTEQFDVSDQRTLDEVVCWLMDMGYIPSFCTACYREGRTGDRFMQLCKSKQIQNCCHPNALMTLDEYLEDYASPHTREVGRALIQKEIPTIPSQKVQQIVRENLDKIKQGSRDFRF